MKGRKQAKCDQVIKGPSETQFGNLIRSVPSGTYYARLRVKGKLVRKTLKTDVLSVAKLKPGRAAQPLANRTVLSRPKASKHQMT